MCDRNKIKIGDYVLYTPTKGTYNLDKIYTGATTTSSIEVLTTEEGEEALKWRILSMNEDGTVDLISDTPTSFKVQLKGAVGYNNGVTLLNQICFNLYSNTQINAISTSLNKDYVENLMNETGKQSKNNYKYSSGAEMDIGPTGNSYSIWE